MFIIVFTFPCAFFDSVCIFEIFTMNSVITTVFKPNVVFSAQKLFFRSKFQAPRFKPARNLRDYVPKKKKTKPGKFPLFEAHPIKLAPKVKEIPKQKFDYFLVLDFEATCDSPVNLDPQEIIEFPVLKVNAETLQIDSKFHSYVRPVIYPQLTGFCTELTGIIQSMIDISPDFNEVYKNFLSWMEKEELLKSEVKFAFVTCGDPDLDHFFPMQCQVSEIEVPDFMKRWINIKRSFCEVSPYTWPDNLSVMLKYCELEPQGDPHSGVDDALNVARVLKDLAERGLVFSHNGWKKT